MMNSLILQLVEALGLGIRLMSNCQFLVEANLWEKGILGSETSRHQGDQVPP